MIFHIISGLGDGGAEGILYRLCLNDTDNQHVVVSMMGPGKYGKLLENNNITVHCLSMSSGRLTLSGLMQLFSLIKKYRPQVVQTWMYHADLIGGFVSILCGIKCIVWNIRHCAVDSFGSKFSTRVTVKACAFFSHYIPCQIVCCAQSALASHVGIGYAKEKMRIVQNGYELDDFSYNPLSAALIRQEFDLPNNHLILGMVGRYHKLKDHSNLLSALSIVRKYNQNFTVLLVGAGLAIDNISLVAEIDRYGLLSNIKLLGQRSDIPAIMSSLDLHILSSSSEAFPNVLAEAMACGVPCISTNVGDAAYIIGDTGWIVPPRDSIALAGAIVSAVNELTNQEGWHSRKVESRRRIVDNFDIKKMISSYHKVWDLKSEDFT